jgi:hypothetical protein
LSNRRPSSPGPRARRSLVATGLAAAVVLVPGTARADTDPGTDPAGALTTGLTDGLDTVTGALSGAAGGSGGMTTGGTTATGGGTAASGTPGLPGTAAGDLPGAAQLQQLFDQLAGALQISPKCSDGVLQGVQMVVTDLTQLPQQLQDLLGRLSGVLQQGPGDLGRVVPLGGLADGGSLTLPAADPASSGAATVGIGDADQFGDVPLTDDLQALLKTVVYDCLPHPSAASPTTEAVDSPAPEPAAAPAPAAAGAPVAQQAVSYPGYAPTGGVPADSSGGVPPAVLGGVVLLGAAGAAGYRMSSRAARSRG